MYKYDIYMTGSQTISGEIADPKPIIEILDHKDDASFTFEDSEGTVVIRPGRVDGISYWLDKAKGQLGFAPHTGKERE